MTDFVEQIFQNKKNYQGIIFLDRDGTIIENVPYLYKKSQLKILPMVNEGVRLLNQYSIAVIVITNQPSIARGLLTINQLKEINDALVRELDKNGVVINAIYSCPHHPEKNHSDIPPFATQYRKECDCRKPQTAMCKKAVKEFGSQKILGMIGDHERDVLTAKNFSIPSVMITNEFSKQKIKPDYICNNFLDAVKALL